MLVKICCGSSRLVSCNLYLTTPITLQKESDQSIHPVPRKRPKRAYILDYFGIILKQQNWTTVWTFSLDRMIGLNRFLLHCARLLEIQV